MIDNDAALDAVIRHPHQDDDLDPDDVGPLLATLSGDVALLPRVRAALDVFLDEGNFYGRDLMAGLLAETAGAAALPVLLRASARDLGDDQDSLRSAILEAVATDREAGRAAVLALLRDADTDPGTRREAFRLLGFVADERDAGLLAEAARDPDPAVRLVAVEEGEISVVVGALRDADEGVRLAALTRLGGSGQPEAITPVAAIATDPSPRVRRQVAFALGRLGGGAQGRRDGGAQGRRAEGGDRRAAGAGTVEVAVAVLVRLLRDEDGQVCDQALDALGTVGGVVAVRALLGELAAATGSRERVQVAKALAKTGEHVEMMARHDDPEVRAATISGLATVADGSSRWAGLVAEMAGDPEAGVRQRVAVVARHLAPDDVAAILERLAADDDRRVRDVAAAQQRRT